MTEIEVKAAVRERDGFKCVRCGMTAEQHISEYDQTLHVHRLMPGCDYEADWCVTMCVPCHGKMPKRADGVVFGDPEETGMFAFWLNLFNHDDKAVYDALARCSKESGKSVGSVLDNVVRRWAAEQACDVYCI